MKPDANSQPRNVARRSEGPRKSEGSDRRQPETDLLLRPWVEADVDGMRQAIDEDVHHLRPWLGWTLEEPLTLARTKLRLREYGDQFRKRLAFRYAITPKNRPAVILGGVHLKRRSGSAVYEVGYWVRGSAVRQGIASAAVARLVVHAFDHRHAKRLLIRCDTANERSAAFAQAIGFEFLGEGRASYPNGEPRPVLEFDLTRENYHSRHAETLRKRAGHVRLMKDSVALALIRGPSQGEAIR